MKRHSLEREEIEEKHELRQVTQLEDLMWAVRWWATSSAEKREQGKWL